MSPEQYKGNGADGPNGAGHNGDGDGTNGTGNGRFSGPGFGTLMIQMASGPKETPPVASSRAYLRNGLPALYQDGDFGMRFVGALEELLDPIVAVLDALPHHFDPNFAPPDILNLLAAWLGVDLDETQDISHQREMVLRSAELGRRRGTVKGMELALKLHFPEAADARRGQRRRDLARASGPGAEALLELRRLLRRPRRGNDAGGDRPLHRAVQAGAQHVPAADQGSKAEGRVMRTCQSCGKENPDDRDFCSCGEYLRWEPTGFVQAITPEMAAEAAAQAAPPTPPEPTPAPPPPTPTARVSPVPPPPPPRRRAATAIKRRRRLRRPLRAPPTANSLPVVQRVQPPQPPAEPSDRADPGARRRTAACLGRRAQQNEPATIVLRLADGDPAKGETLHQAVEPGQRETVLALVRNQSGIVDNYDLRVEGMPQDWWSIFPGTVYLVPFGSGGTYEQEVEIHLHPPRGPEAEARVWDLRVVADSKAHSTVAAQAPLALHIQPYVETATTLRPQRRRAAARPPTTSRWPTGPTRRCWSRSTAKTPTASCASASTARRRRSPPAPR